MNKVKGLKSKDLLGLKDLSVEEIKLILDTARSMKEVISRPIPKVPTLLGKHVVTLFYEPSTRTRTSFNTAAKVLLRGIAFPEIFPGMPVRQVFLMNPSSLKTLVFIIQTVIPGISWNASVHDNQQCVNPGPPLEP